ncbi:MAG: hypothetical protein R2879_08140 [Saprospiraceae bacterium]
MKTAQVTTLAEPMVSPDNQDDLSIDFGLVSLDYGDLPDTYGTTEGENGPTIQLHHTYTLALVSTLKMMDLRKQWPVS